MKYILKQVHVVSDISVLSGGLGLAALRFAHAVAKAGAEVILFVARRTDDEIDFSVEKERFNVVSAESASAGAQPGFFSLLAALRACLDATRPDLLHIHGTWTPILAASSFLAHRRGIAVIVSPHGCLEPRALAHRHFKKSVALALYQRRVFSAASMIVATSPQECAGIRNMGFMNPVAILPNGVDIISAPSRNVGDVRKLLFLSRIHPIKGVLDLVQAWARVRKAGWRVVVAGPDEGGFLATVRALVSKLGLEEDFEFPGLVVGDDKERYFSEADIFILPTYSENFGIVVAEALAREVPVITTTGAPWAQLEEYGCGWWVEPGVEGVAGALTVAMATSRERLAEMGERGRHLVESQYSWQQIGRDAIAAGDWVLLKDRSPPGCIRI